MNKTTGLALIALGVLTGALFWGARSRQAAPDAVLPPAESPAPVSTETIAPPPPQPERPKAPAPLKIQEAKKAAGIPTPPVIELHEELIPKDIEIVRCYYSQTVAAPGTTFGFDINGTGFTAEFQKMIKVEVENKGIQIKNLALVTANQIHGDMVVGESAQTDFVYPRVMIKGLAVFSAPQPFAVVRKGEVLNISFTQMAEHERGGQFRVVTNLDEELFKQFRIEPSTPGLRISAVQPQLPHLVMAQLRLEPGIGSGQYGLRVMLGSKQIFLRENMVNIVPPNVGVSGIVQGLQTQTPYQRPGDPVHILLLGSGFVASDVEALSARVNEFEMGKGTFTYISSIRMGLSLDSSPAAPPGSYSVAILGPNGQSFLQKKDAFKLVGPDWIAGIETATPAKVGKKNVLNIAGRDLSPQFVQNLKIETDEPGLTIGGIKRVDALVATAEITISSKVAPGDYWLHLSSQGKKIIPPYGSIIKIEP